MEPQVRELIRADASAYHAIRWRALVTEPEAFASSASEWAARPIASVGDDLERNAASPDVSFLGAFDAANLVGVAGLVRRGKPKLRHKAEVVAVYVRPAWRRRGVAGRLLDEILARARDLRHLEQLQLGVARHNAAAVNLYRSRGFRAFGLERRALYVEGRPVDEVLMQRYLP